MPSRLPLSPRTRHVLGMVCILLTGCGDQPAADSPPAGAAREPAAGETVAGEFSAAEFAELRWLDGAWRGTMPDSTPFFERYRVVDDTTIQMHAFADPAMSRATDSARIVWRGGRIYDEGATARWVVTRMDSTGVHFAPERGATNHFSWTRRDEDGWTATIRLPDRAGGTREVVYLMERHTP